MVRNKFSLLVYGIIGLAAIGIVYQLFTSPAGLFKSIFITLGVAAAVFGLVYFFFFRSKKSSSDEMKKYKNAVKQSKAKYGNPQKEQSPSTKTHKKTGQTKKRAHKRAPYLRVIEGNKDKGKDRANY